MCIKLSIRPSIRLPEQPLTPAHQQFHTNSLQDETGIAVKDSEIAHRGAKGPTQTRKSSAKSIDTTTRARRKIVRAPQ